MKYLLPSVALGAAPFVMQASESVIAVAFNASLRGYGGDIAVGAMTILTSVMQFAMLPLQGLAQGAQPIIGYNFGAVNPERIKRVFKTLLAVSLTYSFLLWGAVMLFPRAFAAIFTSNSALISYTASVLRVYCSALLIFGIQVASQMTFVALGRALDSVTVAVMRKFVLLLPLILLLPRIFTENPALSVYLAEPVADILAVSFTAVLFAVRFKKIISELEKKKEGKIPEEK
jgi:Na+-driven multidrug efflux pump